MYPMKVGSDKTFMLIIDRLYDLANGNSDREAVLDNVREYTKEAYDKGYRDGRESMLQDVEDFYGDSGK